MVGALSSALAACIGGADECDGVLVGQMVGASPTNGSAAASAQLRLLLERFHPRHMTDEATSDSNIIVPVSVEHVPPSASLVDWADRVQFDEPCRRRMADGIDRALSDHAPVSAAQLYALRLRLGVSRATNELAIAAELVHAVVTFELVPLNPLRVIQTVLARSVAVG